MPLDTLQLNDDDSDEVSLRYKEDKRPKLGLEKLNSQFSAARIRSKNAVSYSDQASLCFL